VADQGRDGRIETYAWSCVRRALGD
jgi:hypothetical protein